MGAHKDRLIHAADLLDMDPDVLLTLLDAHAADRIAAGVREGNLSWADVAEQSARGRCPASPDGTEPHIVTDGRTCDECGATD